MMHYLQYSAQHLETELTDCIITCLTSANHAAMQVILRTHVNNENKDA